MRDKIRELFGKDYDAGRMSISIVSFGFKYGIPLDADTIVDVRFLPNPYYVKELKPLNGRDQAVKDYVFKNGIASEFMDRFLSLLEFVLPFYLKEGKSHLVIGIGCTGGQHRSVAIAEKTAEHLRARNFYCTVNHRDID